MPKTYPLPEVYQGLPVNESGLPGGIGYRSDIIPEDGREIRTAMRKKWNNEIPDPDFRQVAFMDNGANFTAVDRLGRGKINLDWLVREQDGFVEEFIEKSEEIAKIRAASGRH